MAAQMTERCTLVRAFVEFEMLPDLLAQVPQPSIPNLPGETRGFAKPEIDEAEAIRAWTEHGAITAANIDPVDPVALSLPRTRGRASPGMGVTC